MSILSKELIKYILTEEPTPFVGVLGGGFKPPTKGHFYLVKKSLEHNISKLIIFVGSGVRDNITQEQSLAIWNIYKKYLPKNIEIVPSQNPITSIYDYSKNNPSINIKWFLGARNENLQDKIDFDKRTKSIVNKPNLTPVLITTPISTSGTNARKALNDKEEFFSFLPSELSLEDKEKIFNILNPNLNEWVPKPEIDDIDDYADNILNPLDLKITSHFIDRVNDRRNNPPIEADELYDFFDKLSDEKDELENALDDEGEVVATDSDTDINIPLAKDNQKSNTIVAKTIMRKRNFLTPNKKLVFEDLENNDDFMELMNSLTEYMSNHINISPLPNVEFINDDIDNASDMLGNTAYYDPNTQTIALYTYNRHPKDILRSYAHEMIHHKQNLEDRIKNIQGQNINEDEYLKELEEEAYRLGNGLLFRGWENSLK